MKKLILFSALTLLVLTVGKSQIDQATDSVFQQTLEQSFLDYAPIGVSVAIKTDQAIWKGAIGKNTDMEDLTTDGIFGIGSVTKTITAATILSLVEDGLLTLDDPINYYLDSFPNIAQDITIRELLSHTSGIFNYTEHPAYFPTMFSDMTSMPTIESVLNTFVLEPNFEAGTSWAYSNTNYILLGLIIEAVSGKSYHETANEQFDFETNYPSFSLRPQELPADDLVHLWIDTTFAGGEKIDFQNAGMSLTSVFSTAWSAGAYAGTPSDLATWSYDLYSGSLLNDNTMNEMFLTPPTSPGYALGVNKAELPCGLHVVGHTGSIYYTTATAYDPINKVAISVHCNDANVPAVAEILLAEFACVYESLLTTSTNEASSLPTNIEVFPNPFQETINIQYETKTGTAVEIALYNELGTRIATKVMKKQASGHHSVSLNTANLPEGIYILNLQNGQERISQKVVKMAIK